MDLTVFHLGLSTAVSAWPWKKQEEEREGCRKLLNSIRHLGGSFMVGVKSKGRDLHFRISLVRRPDFSWTLKTRAGIGCSNGTGSFWDLGLEYIPPLKRLAAMGLCQPPGKGEDVEGRVNGCSEDDCHFCLSCVQGNH